MTRFTVRLERDAGLESFPGVRSPGAGRVVDVVALATHEGDGWRVWGARTPSGARLFLTRDERARAEAAVTERMAARGAQADLFGETEARAS